MISAGLALATRGVLAAANRKNDAAVTWMSWGVLLVAPSLAYFMIFPALLFVEAPSQAQTTVPAAPESLAFAGSGADSRRY